MRIFEISTRRKGDDRNINYIDHDELMYLFDVIAKGEYRQTDRIIGKLKGVTTDVTNKTRDWKDKAYKIFKNESIDNQVTHRNILEGLSPEEVRRRKAKLIGEWERAGKPMDDVSIFHLLQTKMGLSKNDIKAAVNKAYSDRPKTLKLAKEIHDLGLTEPVLDMLSNPRLLSSRANNTKRYESIEFNISSKTTIFEEDTGLSDKSLKALFKQISTNPEEIGVQDEHNKQETNTLSDVYNMWKSEFDRADKQAKKQVVTSVVNKLTPHYKKDGWDKVSNDIINDINNEIKTNDDPVYQSAIRNIKSGKMMESLQITNVKKIVENKMYGRQKR